MNTNTLNAFNLAGRIALVTGASKGMGRSIAAILAQAGARVVISSRNQVDCDRVAAEISPEPGQRIGIASNIGTRSLRPPCVPISLAYSGTLPTRWHAPQRVCPWVGSGKPTMSQASLFY